MSFWIELRCDQRKTGCYSDQNAGPMQLSGTNRGDVMKTTRYIEKTARERGWRKINVRGRYQWICPSCRRSH